MDYQSWVDSKFALFCSVYSRDTDYARYSRLLVGQNRHEVYLMFAKPDKEYQAYLDSSHNAKKDRGFLSIQACGPWSLTKKEDLDELCEILLAIIIRASEAV